MRRVIPIKPPLRRNRPLSEPAQAVDYRSDGDSNRDAKQWVEAATAYCRHLDANPEDAAIWIQAGNCFKESGNFARSLAAYRKAEELEPNNFEVHLQLGHLHKVCGHLSAALAAYERAAALDPDFGEITHEIRALSGRIRAAPPGSAAPVRLVGSIEELLDEFRKLPADEDPFAAYFRSVGGYVIDRQT